MKSPHVIVIGASAGGVPALTALVGSLPRDLDAAVLIVMHVLPSAPSLLPAILQRVGPLPVDSAEDGAPLRPATIAVAHPDRHLLVRDGHVVISDDPPLRNHRPAIDLLFRSAAVGGPAVTGVLLSGLLDDGVEGLRAIRDAGGTTIAQHPSTAQFDHLPRTAIERGVVDHVLGVHELGPRLTALRHADRPGSR